MARNSYYEVTVAVYDHLRTTWFSVLGESMSVFDNIHIALKSIKYSCPSWWLKLMNTLRLYKMNSPLIMCEGASFSRFFKSVMNSQTTQPNLMNRKDGVSQSGGGDGPINKRFAFSRPIGFFALTVVIWTFRDTFLSSRFCASMYETVLWATTKQYSKE